MRAKRILAIIAVVLIAQLFGCAPDNKLENTEYFNGYMDGFMEAQKQTQMLIDMRAQSFYSSHYKNGIKETTICPSEMVQILNPPLHSLVDITDKDMCNKTIYKNYQNWLRNKSTQSK